MLLSRKYSDTGDGGKITMKARAGIIFALFLSTFSVVFAQSQSVPRYSHSELHRMMQEAHTEQQYRVLAGYFRSRQQAFEQQAKSEKQGWIRQGQIVTGPPAKYPRPVDSSRNRYEYFAYRAGQMGEQADHYESRSAKTQ
jgi:hypothetical protein